jgi:hypothetical protein
MSRAGQAAGAYQGSWQSRRKTTPFTDGQPCIRCRKPIRSWHKRDLDHVYPVWMYGGGGPVAWAHSRCNRQHGGRAGALKTNRMRAARRARGEPDTRAAGLRRGSPPKPKPLTQEQRARESKW